MMTADSVVDAALEEARAYSDRFPGNRTSYYRRISRRLQVLYAAAARVNPEWAGVQAIGPWSCRAADFQHIIRGQKCQVPTAERIQRVEISELEEDYEGPLRVNQEVHIVPLAGKESAFPPRVTYRDGVFRDVGDDMDGVAFIRVLYPRRPEPITRGYQPIDLNHPWEQILTLDLAIGLLRGVQLVSGDPLDGPINMLQSEEEGLLQSFLAHVTVVAPEYNRFAPPILDGALKR
jgi:hypothetical protein